MDPIADFCRRLPKIELHAHLNGSVSRETIKELLAQLPSSSPLPLEFEAFEKQCSLTSLDSFFPLFKFVYGVSNTVKNVQYIAQQVIREFAADGCQYLELRSTPRAYPNTDLVSKRAYVEACLAGTHNALAFVPGMHVRWILSLDRRHSLEECIETVDTAIEFMDRGVVGVDLCGEPKAGRFKDLMPALAKARAAGLKVTLHIAEIENHEQETRDMIDFIPDRIGHGTFLLDDLKEHVVNHAIPIEVCITSNIACKTVAYIEDHHFHGLYFKGHPCILCTDDKGIFSCTLSGEYLLAASHFGLSTKAIFELAYQATDYIFASDEIKASLQALFQRFKEEEKL
ncbi:hypothetical protein BASA50_003665 [Batrachochytrium salamandrivorans]|uniref:Adenosine deaminase domain-containing protein n=1 Tax=Batrachochytrium salamandrivorans TaxID=1357716 RepID=A0ABQ8FJC0_9FUNG|nr:hypothetical protein BASA50_003665 [Batrachochytrium salamandrivorans]